VRKQQSENAKKKTSRDSQNARANEQNTKISTARTAKTQAQVVHACDQRSAMQNGRAIKKKRGSQESNQRPPATGRVELATRATNRCYIGDNRSPI
jgi:hypothetical protein